jgi:hypothetical protein
MVVILSMLAVSFSFNGCRSSISSDEIDRYELVNRHNILIEGFDSLNSLSIGNGDFAFTTDITGLQTFFEEYSNGVPLGTQSNWGWHVNPNPENYEISESVKMYRVNGRDVPYLHQYTGDSRQARASEVAMAKDGMWLYLFTPGTDRLKSERIVNMKYHDYELEPNVHFSPDGKWVIFRANFKGAGSEVFAVEVK